MIANGVFIKIKIIAISLLFLWGSIAEISSKEPLKPIRIEQKLGSLYSEPTGKFQIHVQQFR